MLRRAAEVLRTRCPHEKVEGGYGKSLTRIAMTTQRPGEVERLAGLESGVFAGVAVVEALAMPAFRAGTGGR